MTITILGNHGHSFEIAPVHLQIITERNYELAETRHGHTLTLTAAQMQTLADGGRVTASTSSAQSHSHTVIIDAG